MDVLKRLHILKYNPFAITSVCIILFISGFNLSYKHNEIPLNLKKNKFEGNNYLSPTKRIHRQDIFASNSSANYYIKKYLKGDLPSDINLEIQTILDAPFSINDKIKVLISLFILWSEKDFDLAFQESFKLNEYALFIQAELFKNLVETNWRKALTYLSEHFILFKGQYRWTEYFIDRFTREDPDFALSWILQNQENLHSSSLSFYSKSVARSITLSLAEKRQLFEKIIAADSSAIHGILKEWAHFAPEEAQIWMEQQSYDQEVNARILFAQGYAQYDLRKSLSYIQSLSEFEKKSIVESVLWNNAVTYSAQDMLYWYDMLLPITSISNENKSMIDRFILESPDKAFDWIRNQSLPELKKELIQEYDEVMDIPYYEHLKEKLHHEINEI